MARTLRWLSEVFVVAGLALAVGCGGTVDLGDDAESGTGGDSTGGDGDGTPDPGGPPPGSNGLTDTEIELFETINAERVAMGLPAVELRDDLNCAARVHSDDIGVRRACTHTGADGSSPGDRVAACPNGAGWSGEIVACGQGTPRAAVDGWIGSPGHNAIMFDPNQRRIGVAMHENFWTAIFDR